MAGLFAWAADVVKRGNSDDSESDQQIPIIFAPEQQRYYDELRSKASKLSRTIQDLRLRLPPPDISQRLPHLHAHSLASTAALTAQLNAHSATREQIQSREIKLLEENVAYEKAISDCRNKIQDKLQEAEILRRKLEELDATEKSLRTEQENSTTSPSIQSAVSDEPKVESNEADKTQADRDGSGDSMLRKLEEKKKELCLMEETVQNLEKQWAQVQDKVLKQPTPAQREKILDKQLRSLIEQLETKQAQAEGLVSEIHLKENELETLNGLARRLDTNSGDFTATRNRFGRSGSYKGSASSSFSVDSQLSPPFYISGRSESQQKLMLLRSAFVVYILALQILVFIKISF